jgi:HAD superfamily hydrolase (TIGR01509 family)
MRINFDAVLWDMDGTLIDSEKYWLEAEIELMKRFSVRWTEHDQSICLGGPMARVERYMAERANFAEEPAYFGRELKALMVKKLSRPIDYAPGAFDLLQQLRRAEVPMGLVTASSRSLVDAALLTLGRDTFKVVISGDDVEEGKPSPEGYLAAARALDAEISKTVILEDSFVGTTAALASGATVIGISHIGELAKTDEGREDQMLVVNSLEGISIETLMSAVDQRRALA